MKKLNNKKGISLIVLVITIVVMIILAAAIILSLSSSGVIKRANEAKVESDITSKKQAAVVALAEYELERQMGETTKTATEYVQDKLNSQNLDGSDVAVTKDGKILVGLNDVAIRFVEAGVEIGDVVKDYILSEDEESFTYTTSGNENKLIVDNTETDLQPAILTRDKDVIWIYFGINEKGEAEIAANSTESSPKMTLSGKGGYLNGINELNNACEKMYSSSMGKARCINMDDIIRVLEYKGERAAYYDITGEYIPLKEAYTIEKLLKDNDIEEFTNIFTPDGEDIYKYKSDYFEIRKAEYGNKFGEVIYYGTTNTLLNKAYWIAHQSCTLEVDYNDVVFYIMFSGGSRIRGKWMFSSENSNGKGTYSIRPVVALDNKVKIKSYENNVVRIEL